MFKKITLIMLIAMLGLSVLPTSSAYAASGYDETTPPEGVTLDNERLEKAWSRALKVEERLGNLFEKSDTFIERIQKLIEKANERGLDTTAVQAALDDFVAGVGNAHPIYEEAQDLIADHQGFDEDGKVVDAADAVETLKALRGKMQEMKTAFDGSFKSLREAIKDFRDANPRPATEGDNS